MYVFSLWLAAKKKHEIIKHNVAQTSGNILVLTSQSAHPICVTQSKRDENNEYHLLFEMNSWKDISFMYNY